MIPRRAGLVLNLAWMLAIAIVLFVSRAGTAYEDPISFGPIHLTRGELICILGLASIVIGLVAMVFGRRAWRERVSR
jgi:hypothetical protein